MREQKTVIFRLLGILMIFAASAQAQYKVHSWESFEEGQVPNDLVLGHNSNEDSVKPFSLSQSIMGRSLNDGYARLECGNFGLAFEPSEEYRHLSIFSEVSLNRDRLGSNGQALYQMDVYLPEEGQPIPNISLLAQVLENEGAWTTPYTFYRFGIREPGDRIFFSFVNNEPNPEIFYAAPISEMNLKRPGWHRLQIVFVGQNQIYCAIDGKETSFSPITEPTHTRLHAGAMVTSSDFTSKAIIDNLSIQWTPNSSPLPESPWLKAVEDQSAPNASALESGSNVIWFNDPDEAWRVASSQNRPVLTLFYAPNIGPYNYLKSIVPNTQEVHDLLNQYILLKLDANQLKGGTIAENMNVVRLPTFLVINSNGNVQESIPVIRNQTTWNDLKGQLFPGQ